MMIISAMIPSYRAVAAPARFAASFSERDFECALAKARAETGGWELCYVAGRANCG